MPGTKVERMLACSLLLAVVLMYAGAKAAPAAIFTVTNTNDSGAGSLRAAIEAANAHDGGDKVVFAIPGAGPHTIAITSAPLPSSTGPLILDATTQPGYSGSPLIHLDNVTGSPDAIGLHYAARGQIRGLSITQFGVGILASGSEAKITANWIGLDPSGAASGNATGIKLTGPNNVVGGIEAGTANVASGNAGSGIEILGSAATINIVQGNYVGTDASGTGRRPNVENGILIHGGASENRIGGKSSGMRNVISGNIRSGVAVTDSGTVENEVWGNFIGVDVTGAAAIGNGQNGVDVSDGGTAFIGADVASAGNVISGNVASGVAIDRGSARIEFNSIGVDTAGDVLPNGRHGINVFAGSATIGEQGGNVISGNRGSGIRLESSGALVMNSTITRNNVGVEIIKGGATIGHRKEGGNLISDNAKAGIHISGRFGNRIHRNTITDNGGSGIAITSGSSSNLIGGEGLELGHTGAGNTIARNGLLGISINGRDTCFNQVSGNSIYQNALHGVQVFKRACSNQIGGLTAGGIGSATNYISGNGRSGIAIGDANDNAVQGNVVNSNGEHGIHVSNGAARNLIGGIDRRRGDRSDRLGNRVGGNIGAGVLLTGAATVSNSLLANLIGANGGLGISLLNGANRSTPTPTITSIAPAAGGTEVRIEGELQANPATDFRIEVFASPTCDPSGAGEGADFVRATPLTTDGTGRGTFSVQVVAGLVSGKVVTATATNLATGDTSEFSFCAPA